ncbi:hypothetical protein BRC96_01550 [Halobacteriales archaeon QS_6_64_34]|nr:MAG: hypothetical protein BRC96_01550 [Halobacteriales archaeon QS_6_64_34]
MTGQAVQRLVKDEREQLLDGKDGIEAAVVTRPNRSQTVAIGLLTLGEVAEAKAWFRALVEEWLTYAGNSWEAQYENEPKQSAQRGPWNDYVNAVYCAVLGSADIENAAEVVDKRATEEFVDELENRDLAFRVDLARSLSAYILADPSLSEVLDALERRVNEHGNDWDYDRYHAYARTLRGLQAESESEIAVGIEALLAFHQTHLASGNGVDAVDSAVALDATAMLALARWDGWAITIDHEAIPDALNDDEYYPVGE